MVALSSPHVIDGLTPAVSRFAVRVSVVAFDILVGKNRDGHGCFGHQMKEDLGPGKVVLSTRHFLTS